MLLAIDLGNTRMKWALFATADEPVHTGSCRLGAENELWNNLQTLPAPERVAIACVAGGHWLEGVAAWVSEQWRCPLIEVTADRAVGGLTNGYRMPGQLGADRWAAIVAARAASDQPLIIADAGSACTVDAVDDRGHHKGGLIAPGLKLMQDALSAGTHGIRATSPRLTEGAGVWGTDTDSCVRYGALQALSGLIRSAWDRLEREEGRRVECFLTGGDGEAVAAVLGGNCRYDATLVLKGIARLGREERLVR